MLGKLDPRRSQSHILIMSCSFENKSANQAYVSPSDAIMSPASKKLSAFKQRQYSKATPSRSLFRKAVTAREKDFGPLQ